MPSKAFYEEGNYVAEVVNQALGKANTGTPQFVLRVKILGKSEEMGYSPVEEKERTIYMYLSEKAIKYTVEKLEEIGFAGSSFGQLDATHPQHQSFIGGNIRVYCQHEPDTQNGGDKEKWDISTNTGPATFTVKPIDKSELRRLDAMFGKNLKGSITKNTTTSAITPSQNLGITDDDIPF